MDFGKWQTRSLSRRQLIAAAFGLLAFLAFVGYALDRAFEQAAEQSVKSRMQGYAIAYAAGIDVDVTGALLPPALAPDRRLEMPGSGLYVQIVQPGGTWSSISAMRVNLPQGKLLPLQEEVFDGPLRITADGDVLGTQVYRYGRSFAMEYGNGQQARYTVYVIEDTRPFRALMNVFRQYMWRYLLLAGLVLILLQMLTLRWSLQPLRRVVAELSNVRQGRARQMTGAHPRELAPLVGSINELIESERNNLQRQRNVMSDLAHSLKTPLAVMRTQLEANDDEAALRAGFNTQLNRMNDIVSYQLGRARSGGHSLYAAPIEIMRYAEEISRGLEKVYAQKGIFCEFDVDENARFYGEPGDLQELLGNLLENAFKWAESRVLLTVAGMASSNGLRPGVLIAVEDDGPGIEQEKIHLVLQRGVRGDERVQGHGIGLSIVQDIIHNYAGLLNVGRSQELGGARFEARIPPEGEDSAKHAR